MFPWYATRRLLTRGPPRAVPSAAMTLSTSDLRALRADFPALARRRNGKPPMYLNNTCMTLRPRAVIDAVTRYYTDFPTCGGGRSEGVRTLHSWFGEELAAEEVAAREALARLVNAARVDELVWTRNATEALNIVAHGLPLEPGDRVLLSEREHNSTLVPWLEAEGRLRARVGDPRPRGRRDVRPRPGRRVRPRAGARRDPARREGGRAGPREQPRRHHDPRCRPAGRGRRRAPCRRRPRRGRRTERAAPPRRRAGARDRLPRLLAPQDVRPERRRRALRPVRRARARRAVRRRRRHGARHLARPRRLQGAAGPFRGGAAGLRRHPRRGGGDRLRDPAGGARRDRRPRARAQRAIDRAVAPARGRAILAARAPRPRSSAAASSP